MISQNWNSLVMIESFQGTNSLSWNLIKEKISIYPAFLVWIAFQCNQNANENHI